MDEAWEALQVAIEAMLDARCVSLLWLMCMSAGGVYVRVHVSVAGRTHVWRCVWLQRGELAAGCGGEGDGGGGEARGSQREAVGAGGGGEGHD
jgi:hypothetical protein